MLTFVLQGFIVTTAGFANAEISQAAKDDSSSTPFSWMPAYNLRTLHKVLGYSALASGLTAIGSGILMAHSYDNDKNPRSRVKSVHSIAAAGAMGFTFTAFTTGVLSYASMLDFSDGMNSYTTHALLGTLSTIGFAASAGIAPDGGKNYKTHCRTAEASGGLMLSAVIVIQF